MFQGLTRHSALTYAVFFKVFSSFSIQEKLDGLKEFGAFPVRELCSQAVEHGIHVFSYKPSCSVMILLVGIVPDQGAFKHCDSSVGVYGEYCHMRVSNHTKELLSGTLHGHLCLNAFVNIGTSACRIL